MWWECQTCGQRFTGAMRTGLAEAWWSRVCDEAEESEERLWAAHNLASARDGDGQYAEAERIKRKVLGTRRRLLGEEHPDTLRSAGLLAQSLYWQGKHAEAERIQREVLGAQRRVLGEEHPETLTSASDMALSFSKQGKHAEAERIHREVLEVSRRVLGEKHPQTLTSGNNLAMSLSSQAKHAEAERIQRAVLGTRRRVLGEEHPSTLISAHNLALWLSVQEKHAEAAVDDVEMAPAELDAPVVDGSSSDGDGSPSDGDGSPSDGDASSQEEDEMDAAEERKYLEEALEGFFRRGTITQLEDLYAQLRPRQGRVIRWRSKQERARVQHFQKLRMEPKRRKLVELVLGKDKASHGAEEAAWRADAEARTDRMGIVLMWNMELSDPTIPASYEDLMLMTKAQLERVVMWLVEKDRDALGPIDRWRRAITRWPGKTAMQGCSHGSTNWRKRPRKRVRRAHCAKSRAVSETAGTRGWRS